MKIIWTERRSLQSGHFIDVKKTYENVFKLTMKNDDSIVEAMPSFKPFMDV